MNTPVDLAARRRLHVSIEAAFIDLSKENPRGSKSLEPGPSVPPLLVLHESLLRVLMDARLCAFRDREVEGLFDNFGMETRIRALLYQVRAAIQHTQQASTSAPGGTA